MRMENPYYENENNDRKYLNNKRKNQFWKIKNGILELERDFIELKGRELKDREVKIKREIEEIFLNRLSCL